MLKRERSISGGKRSFERKLLLPFALVVVLFTAVFLAWSAISSLRALSEKNQLELDSLTFNAATQLDDYLNNMSLVSLDMLCRADFMESATILHTNSNGTDFDMLVKSSYDSIRGNLLADSMMRRPYQVVFFNGNNYFLTNYAYGYYHNYGYKVDEAFWDRIPWLEEVSALRGAELLVPPHKDLFLNLDAEVISLVRTVRNPSRNVGYLVVQTEVENLHHIFAMAESINADVVVCDEEGNLIYSTQALDNRQLDFYRGIAEENSGSGLYRVPDRGRQAVSYSTAGGYGWTVIAAKDYAQVTAEFVPAAQTLALAGVLLLALFSLLALYAAKRLAQPLKELQTRMEEVTLDNLQQDYSPIQGSSSEMEAVVGAFMEMRNRLNHMVEKEIAYQSLQLEEHFNTLQSQINPHFMYNTLGVIGIMGEESGSASVGPACSSLADLLKYSISDHRDMATLREEAENARCYLRLLKLRYEHKLEYTVDIVEGLQEMPVPKLILQPFLENAIKHGYGARNRVLQVQVRAYTNQETVCLDIVDNGKGFEAGALSELQRAIEGITADSVSIKRLKDRQGGLGMLNTFARLKIQMGAGVSFQVGNNTAGGAFVRISMERGGEGL